MASVWIVPYEGKQGRRHRVYFRLGGRGFAPKYAGSFKRKRDAEDRAAWIRSELAAMRVPDLTLLEPPAPRMLSELFAEWRRSKIDVTDQTATNYRTSQQKILDAAGDTPIGKVDVAWIAQLVGKLHDAGAARESIRKTVKVHLAMALDFAGLDPNPARDKQVKLPLSVEEELTPPLAAHVEAVFYAIAAKYRLPHLLYDACGMRLRELELLEWRDVDELGHRLRVRKGHEKRRRARWIPWDRFPNEDARLVLEQLLRLVPREDRDPQARVFLGFTGDAYRTELAKSCVAAGVPVFSPNDLRHRRATLWHLQGVPPVDAASWLGHSPAEHLRTYAHASLDERSEIPYPELLFDAAAEVMHKEGR